MPSLQMRLGTGLFLSLLIVFIGLWLVISSAVRFLAEDYIVTKLGHDIDSLLVATRFTDDGKFNLDPGRLNTVYSRPFSGHYFIIQSDTQRQHSRSLWDQDLVLPPLAAGTESILHLRGPQQQPLLVLTRGFHKQGRTLSISVAEDLLLIESGIKRFQYWFSLSAALILTVLVILQELILRTGLRPLQKTGKELQELERGERSQLDPDVPREIAPLVNEINHLFSALVHRLRRSRDALGDLAHTLKKPLTVLQQLIRDEDLAKQSALQQKLATQIDSIQHHTERILNQARLAGEGPPGTWFDLDRDLTDLIDTLGMMYRDKQIRIHNAYPAATRLAADRDDILELLGNILDNACKWAHRQITLEMHPNNGCHIILEDDGPGVDANVLDELAQRGTRLDESTQGHGLGLAIVNDIVSQYRGQLRFGRSEKLGGFRVVIILPVASN